jgi:hypothetical protein
MAVDLGDVLRLNYTHLSPAGAPVSADTMTVTITLPDLTTAGPTTVAPDSTGVYHYDYQTVQVGRHSVRWLGTGANPGAHAEAFDVRTANPPYLASPAALKAQLNMTGTADDDELRLYLEAATGVVERYLKRAVVRRTFTERHTVGHGKLILNWTPVVSLTSVETTDGVTTWDVSGLVVSAAGVVTTATGSISGEVEAVYVAGDAVVVAEWTLAGLIIAQHLWETQRGQAGGPFAGGLDTPGAGITSFGYLIPNRAKELLGEPPPMVA